VRPVYEKGGVGGKNKISQKIGSFAENKNLERNRD
jgi:hypothetical protein